MKQDNINYLVVGVFVLSMFILLLIVLLRISGKTGDTEAYFVHYTNISGIDKGTPVTYGGYHIGQVDDITPQHVNGNTRYRLELALKAGWQIPSDSIARIISPGLLSDDLIDITEGESSTYLKPRDVIQGENPINMMTSLNTVAYEIKDLSDNSIKPLINNLNRQVETIGSDLNTNIPAVTDSMNRLLESLNSSANKLAQLLNEENQQHISNIFQNADVISQQLATMAKGLNNARMQIDRLLDNTNNLISDNSEDIRHSVVDLRDSLGIISENISGIIYNLEGTSRNINEFSRQIRNNPGVLISGSKPKQDEVQR
jgi:phospholipid/cholesterol/gamma-HCH transport system substrate-binding protein